MNPLRSLILIGFGLSLLMLAMRRLRQYRLKERYALLFFLAGLPFVALALWPNGIVRVSDLVGISQSSLMLLLVSMFLFLIVFELLTIVSQQDQKITTLAQMVGILMERQQLNDRPQVTSVDSEKKT